MLQTRHVSAVSGIVWEVFQTVVQETGGAADSANSRRGTHEYTDRYMTRTSYVLPRYDQTLLYTLFIYIRMFIGSKSIQRNGTSTTPRHLQHRLSRILKRLGHK